MAVIHAGKSPKKPEPMSAARFCEEFLHKLKQISPDLEMDFSFDNDAVMLHDMRRPNSIRRGKFYTSQEIKDEVFIIKGDMERRVRAFMEKG
jgi:hypothetical protein